MKRSIVTAFLALFLIITTFAQNTSKTTVEQGIARPKLVVGLVVD